MLKQRWQWTQAVESPEETPKWPLESRDWRKEKDVIPSFIRTFALRSIPLPCQQKPAAWFNIMLGSWCLLCYNLLFGGFCVVCLHVWVCFCFFFACVGTFSKNCSVLKAVDILLESSYYPIFPYDRLLKRAASLIVSVIWEKSIISTIYVYTNNPRSPPPWCILNQDGRSLQY